MIATNFQLKSYNTFGISAFANAFGRFNSIEQLQQLQLETDEKKLMILGGGSNVLFTQNYDGLVAKNEITGIEQVKENEDYVWLKVGGGENWHRFVQYCISHQLGGVENLSLIPGCVGASPMQNIGAYGVEIKDVFEELEAYHLGDKAIARFSLADCAFGYRESVFKRKYKGQFVITHVTYRLSKKPVLNTSYGAIEEELTNMGVQEPDVQTVSQAVINIRQSKLPNPAEIGNAGSFFKNPTIPTGQFEQLKSTYEKLPGYATSIADETKVPAGWLIEQCGWKGYRKGDAGVHAKQALVLVNYGQASGEQIYNLSTEIVQSVEEKFGIMLEREVNTI